MPEPKPLRRPEPAPSNVPSIDTLSGQTNAKVSFSLGVARWMLGTNLVLSLVVITLTQHGEERGWAGDAAFWATYGGLLLVRHVDLIRRRRATPTEGAVSVGEWYRYAGRLFLISLTAWILAHAATLIISRQPSPDLEPWESEWAGKSGR